MIRYAQRGIDKTGEFRKRRGTNRFCSTGSHVGVVLTGAAPESAAPALYLRMPMGVVPMGCGAGKCGAGIAFADVASALCRPARRWRCVGKRDAGAVPVGAAPALRWRHADGCGVGVVSVPSRWVLRWHQADKRGAGANVGPSRTRERRDMRFTRNRKMVVSAVTVALAAAALSGIAQNASTGGDDRRGGRGWPGHRAVPVRKGATRKRGGIPCRHRRRLGHEERRAQRAFQLR